MTHLHEWFCSGKTRFVTASIFQFVSINALSINAGGQQSIDSFSEQSDVLWLAQENVGSSFPRFGVDRARGKNAHGYARAMGQLASAPDQL